MSAAYCVGVGLDLPLSAGLLLYLKHNLVFIWRAGDVALNSTFPSRAVYIREQLWLYISQAEAKRRVRAAAREGREAICFNALPARAPAWGTGPADLYARAIMQLYSLKCVGAGGGVGLKSLF